MPPSETTSGWKNNYREKRQTKRRGQLTAAVEMNDISFKTIFTSKLKRVC